MERETAAGRHYYGCRNSRTNKVRPRDEWIEVKVPAILSEERFQAVQRRLKARNPFVSAPRSHTSPVLLSGLGSCGCNGCTSTMMLMTGKGWKISLLCLLQSPEEGRPQLRQQRADG